jgi:CBS domain-containing protein
VNRVSIEKSSVEPASACREPDAEAVALVVRGGEVAAAITASTPDDDIIAAAGRLRATLRLENEQVLTVEIARKSGRAALGVKSAGLHADRAATVPGDGGESGGARTAEAIMTREVQTASPDELVEDVAKRLAFHNISGMPVEDWDGTVIGIVSELDVIDKLHDTVRDAMSSDVVSVARDTPIEQIAALMAERRIKRVPVLVEGMLVGIVSRHDIVCGLVAGAAGSP